MTRKSKREIERTLDELERTDDAETVIITVGAPDECFVTYRTDDDDDPIDAWSEPAIPRTLSPDYLTGVSVLTNEDIAELWHTMTEEIQEQERDIRRKRGEPIPPVITEDREVTGR